MKGLTSTQSQIVFKRRTNGCRHGVCSTIVKTSHKKTQDPSKVTININQAGKNTDLYARQRENDSLPAKQFLEYVKLGFLYRRRQVHQLVGDAKFMDQVLDLGLPTSFVHRLLRLIISVHGVVHCVFFLLSNQSFGPGSQACLKTTR